MEITMVIEDAETEIIIMETTTMLEAVAEEITPTTTTIEITITTTMEAIPIKMAEDKITRMVHPRMGITLINIIHVIKVIITTTIVALHMEDGIQTITTTRIII